MRSVPRVIDTTWVPCALRLAARLLGTSTLLAWLLVGPATRPASAAAAEQVHWDFQLTVDAPQTIGDPFRTRLITTLVGSHPGIVLPQQATTQYLFSASRPDGTEQQLAGLPERPATSSTNITGGSGGADVSFTPDQNGDWVFNVWQLDGAGNKKLVVQRQVHTDNARVSSSSSDARMQLVSAVSTEPAQPVVGQPASIVVQMTPQALAAGIHQAPVLLVDDDGGIHPLGTVSAGPAGDASLAWVPQQAAANGLLQVGDQAVPLVVLAAPSGPAPANDETPTGPAPSDNAGDQGSTDP